MNIPDNYLLATPCVGVFETKARLLSRKIVVDGTIHSLGSTFSKRHRNGRRKPNVASRGQSVEYIVSPFILINIYPPFVPPPPLFLPPTLLCAHFP